MHSKVALELLDNYQEEINEMKLRAELMLNSQLDIGQKICDKKKTDNFRKVEKVMERKTTAGKDSGLPFGLDYYFCAERLLKGLEDMAMLGKHLRGV